MNSRNATIGKAAVLLLVLASLSLPAWSQSCALCYTQAAGAGPRMIQALKSGILVLIFPPMAICIGLMIMSYKKRNRFRPEGGADRESDLGW
ncbi:MAG TPA: hypothetical protein VE957_23960 [Terriglobales bacterium]|jgi:hypothetical protein|nr:hypothetical protein [Terriglobales bacterium]